MWMGWDGGDGTFRGVGTAQGAGRKEEGNNDSLRIYILGPLGGEGM